MAPDITKEPSAISEDASFSLNISPSGETGSQAPDPVAPISPKETGDDITVYTMPKEFLHKKGKKKKREQGDAGEEMMSPLVADSLQPSGDINAFEPIASSKSRVKIIVGIIALILFLGVGAVAGYLLISKRFPYISSPTPPPPPPPDDGVMEPPPTEEPPPPIEEPPPPPEDISTVLSGDLIQMPVVSYNNQGMKTTEAVLSLEKEQNVNYGLITINKYIVSLKPEYFAYVAGAPYEVQFRGETLKGQGVLTITYTQELLDTLDIIGADLRIGYMPFSRLKENIYRPKVASSGVITIAAEEPVLDYGTEVEVQEDEDGEINEAMIDDTISPEPVEDEVQEDEDGSVEDIGEEDTAPSSDVIVWDVLKAQDLDDDVRSISSVFEEAREGIYAIVPMNVNDLIELPEEPEEEPAPPIGEEIVRAKDSDEDALTDREELLYGTSPLSSDSDNDGYRDGLEVVSLYSPARGNSIRLTEDSQFSYYNNDAGYSFLKPAQFSLSGLDPTKLGDIIMTSAENEAIVMSVQENPGDMTLFDWLASISPEIPISDFEAFETREGFAVLAAPEQTTYYVAFPDFHLVLVVSYTSPAEYGYASTVRMMVESIMMN